MYFLHLIELGNKKYLQNYSQYGKHMSEMIRTLRFKIVLELLTTYKQPANICIQSVSLRQRILGRQIESLGQKANIELTRV